MSVPVEWAVSPGLTPYDEAVRAMEQRAEEIAADRSAITYLERTGQSAAGMLKTFGRFQSALALSGSRIDPYRISHPMPRERIANLETLARQSAHFGKTGLAVAVAHHQIGRRPQPRLKTEALKKLFFDDNFVIACGQLPRIFPQGKGIGKRHRRSGRPHGHPRSPSCGQN